MSTASKHNKMTRRAKRTRAKIHGTSERPRLSVKRSLKHTYVQLINDDAGTTMAAISDKDVQTKGKPVEVAKEIGSLIAKKAESLGIKSAIFDRGPYRYHGRVAAIAEGAREAGLTI
ncbi:MAG: 50S ribosomal protein L18 [bacterium]|jgi:large subunit ribosomal protein L18|nr:50S ribosomal protein L18 [bacterium]